MNEVFKNRLLELMKEKNIKQVVLAEAIGLTQATLSRNLNGVHEPKAEVIQNLAQYFNVSTDYLLGNTDNRNETIEKPSSTSTDDITVAFYNQHGIVTEEQKKEVESFIQFLKSKDEK